MYIQHNERHRIARISWLRAAVLGANDGIISTASLLIGIAAAHTNHSGIVVAGIAALMAGAMSMAAGEYISVSSQADMEKAELAREKWELETSPVEELDELTQIYVGRGLELELAKEVAQQLMAKDALGAHARDELGITGTMRARPLEAALFSACSFTVGAILPVFVAILAPASDLIPTLAVMAIVFLGLLGSIAAKVGAAPVLKGALRVAAWGSLAMLASAAIGSFLGTVV